MALRLVLELISKLCLKVHNTKGKYEKATSKCKRSAAVELSTDSQTDRKKRQVSKVNENIFQPRTRFKCNVEKCIFLWQKKAIDRKTLDRLVW